MEERTAIPSREELEATLKEIRGISAVRVVLEAGGIAAVHILAEPDRNPKQVVRDVESALQAKYGIAVDHKKISVAQMEDNNHIPVSGRPCLVSIGFSTAGNTARAQVELEFARDLYQGEAQGPGTSYNKLRLVAIAALKALEDIVRQRCVFFLEDVVITRAGRWDTALVVVSAMLQSQEERLVGAVLVEGDQLEAVVKAVLSAVNRRLSVLLG